MSAVTNLTTKMFVLRRIPAENGISYTQLEKCVLNDLASAVEALKDNPCTNLLEGAASLPQIVRALQDAGVIEVVGPAGADYLYRRTQLAVEWESAIAVKFPAIRRALDAMPMSTKGLLETLARG